jgi:hypothetical protein
VAKVEGVAKGWGREGMWRKILDLGYQEGMLKVGKVAVDATTVEARKGWKG